MKFCPDFATNSRKEWRVSLLQSNLRKQIRKLPKILTSDSVKIIHYYSFVSLASIQRALAPLSAFFAGSDSLLRGFANKSRAATQNLIGLAQDFAQLPSSSADEKKVSKAWIRIMNVSEDILETSRYIRRRMRRTFFRALFLIDHP